MDIDPGVITFLYVAGGAVMAAIFLWDWHVDRCADRLPSLSEFGVNDDDRAATVFKEVLNGTGRSLLVYDDGNVSRASSSFYNEPSVADAVASRLRECRDLKVYCFFNCPAKELHFVETLQRDFPTRFMAKARRGGKRPDDQHFKIGDRGRIGYLSQHALHDDNRAFSKFDLRHSPFALRWLVFGHHLCVFWLRWRFIGVALP